MNSVPLVDAIPWIRREEEHATTATTARTWLINDSTETDGRFLMYSLAAAQAKSQKSSSSSSSSFRRATDHTATATSTKLIWLSCGPSTGQEVAQSLKKAGCDEATQYLRQNTLRKNHPSSSSNLFILPVSLELSNLLALSSNGEEKTDNIHDKLWNENSHDYYLKKLYQTVKSEVTMMMEPPTTNESNRKKRVLVFIDDVSYLSALFGNSMTFLFLQQIRSLLHSSNNNTIHPNGNMLTIRCMNETDQQLALLDDGTNEGSQQQTNSSDVRGGKNLQWVGAGGNVSRRLSNDHNNNTRQSQFSRSICELANVIMDVMPLQSGFSREVHGRILFSHIQSTNKQQQQPAYDMPSKQLSQTSKKLPRDDSLVLNYCCSESGVKVMRLRS